MILFWFLGVATLFLVALCAIWMPTWAAAATVAGILLLVAGTLAGLGLHRFKKLENPKNTVVRRWEDHRSWWEGRLIAGAVDEPPAEIAEVSDMPSAEEGEVKE